MIQNSVVARSASVRLALLNQPLAPEFMTKWLLWGTFQPVELAPKELPPITPDSELLHRVVPGQNRSHNRKRSSASVTRLAKWATHSSQRNRPLLRVIPYILPKVDGESLYRLVLQHDDLRLHNMSIFVNGSGQATVTSIYDWQTANIVSDFDFSTAGCDLRVDDAGRPWVHTRSPSEAGAERLAKNQQHSEDFLKVSILDRALFQYLNAIRVVIVLPSSHKVDPRQGTISHGGIRGRKRCTESLVRPQAIQARHTTRKIFLRSGNSCRVSNEEIGCRSRRRPPRRRRTGAVGCPGCGVAKRGAQPWAKETGGARVPSPAL